MEVVMEFLDTLVSREDDLVNVTFNGQGGERIVVSSRVTPTTDLDNEELVRTACALMVQAINHSMHDDPGDAEQLRSGRAQEIRQALESPAVRSYQSEKRDRRRQESEGDESELTRGLEASFPASDPISPTSSVTAGPAPSPSERVNE
jgi:hypothetical protein